MDTLVRLFNLEPGHPYLIPKKYCKYSEQDNLYALRLVGVRVKPKRVKFIDDVCIFTTKELRRATERLRIGHSENSNLQSILATASPVVYVSEDTQVLNTRILVCFNGSQVQGLVPDTNVGLFTMREYNRALDRKKYLRIKYRWFGRILSTLRRFLDEFI